MFCPSAGTRPYLTDIRQRAQFFVLDGAAQLSLNSTGFYPPSAAQDDANLPYCGAMKLAEAVVGQDALGFHPSSRFRLDGVDPETGKLLYTSLTLEQRRKTDFHESFVCRLADVYGKGRTGPFAGDALVLCDVFTRDRPSGRKTGMPILYYRANHSGTAHDVNNPDNPANIYNYRDNHALIGLGAPGEPNAMHPLADPKRFYLHTENLQITSASQPYQSDSFILISAGRDGLYGTADDICNFAWKYREQ